MPSENRFLFRVYGDSLSMARAEAGIAYHDTYWNIIAEKCAEKWKPAHVGTYVRHNPGWTVIDLLNQYSTDSAYFGGTPGDLLILQCGICDCAPRPVSVPAREKISRMPKGIRGVIVDFLHKNRPRLLRSGISWRVVEPDRFREVYQVFLRKVVKELPYVCVINIAPTTKKNEEHSPGLSASIELYNQIIKDIVDSISANNLLLLDVHREILTQENALERCINQTDGHHLTKDGQLLYAEMFFSKVLPALKLKSS